MSEVFNLISQNYVLILIACAITWGIFVGLYFLNKLILKQAPYEIRRRLFRLLSLIELLFGYVGVLCLLHVIFKKPAFTFVHYVEVAAVFVYTTIMLFILLDIIIGLLVHFGIIVHKKRCACVKTQTQKPQAKPEKTEISKELTEEINNFTRTWLIEHIQTSKNVTTRYEIMTTNKADYIKKLSDVLKGKCENVDKIVDMFYHKFIDSWK